MAKYRYTAEVWWLKIRKYVRMVFFAVALAGFVLAAGSVMFGPVVSVPIQSVTIGSMYIGKTMLFMVSSLLFALLSLWVAKLMS